MQVKDLTKRYDGKTVVNEVSFAIPKGKVISLIGPNGAGKSTVMGIISRLIARDGGTVDFEGSDIGKVEKPGAVQAAGHSDADQQYPDEADGLGIGELWAFSLFRGKDYGGGSGGSADGRV